MSGFSSGLTVMNSANLHDLQQMVSLMSCQAQQMSSHYQAIEGKDTVSTKGHCEVVSDAAQICCDTACVASLAALTTPHVLITVSTSLALVTSLISGDVIRKTQSLYRPPIA
ncbi:hypothetical protein ACGRPC_21370 [Vibrio diabolicus]|uniref:hypothetical protein n=1 Tax=Vibrio harveyi group TaxID=717610 RepID=UPI001BD2F609|nr:hypothetical protein [Vibrio alginolyticus]MBS9857738.1 hypothetical protein [Vibrio alginolyticus]MCS0083713.1 hypothetical protein [Vibrio alginolyticus]